MYALHAKFDEPAHAYLLWQRRVEAARSPKALLEADRATEHAAKTHILPKH